MSNSLVQWHSENADDLVAKNVKKAKDHGASKEVIALMSAFRGIIATSVEQEDVAGHEIEGRTYFMTLFDKIHNLSGEYLKVDNLKYALLTLEIGEPLVLPIPSLHESISENIELTRILVALDTMRGDDHE